MNPEVIVDVRSLHPRDRHPKIFREWDSLQLAGTLRLVNDHDPKPLFYEFVAERNGESNWNYIEKGPEKWVVDIKKVALPKSSDETNSYKTEPILIRPSWLRIPPDQEIDVREDLRKGLEPLSKIMSVAQNLGVGRILMVRAIFEPKPLYNVLGSKGFEHWTEQDADDDWKVYFFKAGESSSKIVYKRHQNELSQLNPTVHKLDVRGLEPPEPMVRILSKLQELGPEDILEVTHFREPIHLYPHLQEAGFKYEIEKLGETLYILRIKVCQ